MLTLTVLLEVNWVSLDYALHCFAPVLYLEGLSRFACSVQQYIRGSGDLVKVFEDLASRSAHTTPYLDALSHRSGRLRH